MARSLFRDLLLDRRGNALSNITVDVFTHATTTPVPDTIYASATGPATLTNPFTVTSTNRGEVIFYLDLQPGERVDVRYSGASVVTETVTLDGVSPDDLGAGGGVTDHGALTGLANDDHPQYETSAEVNAKIATHEGAADPHPTYLTSAEGDAAYVNEGDHTAGAHNALGLSHDSLADVSADDHHAQSHSDTQHTDGPNSKPGHTHSHDADLTGVSADDHHAQVHTDTQHSDGPNSKPGHTHSHDTDLSGVSADDHHPQSHAHNGVDSSGTVAHSATTGQTTDDHHAKSHTHSGDGSGTVDHGSLTGLTDDDHPQYYTAAEVAADIATHAAAGDPHPTYETSAEAQAKVDVHTTDASDAHDASAISFVPTGTVAATDVQAAIAEVASEAGGGTRELKSFTELAVGSGTYTVPAGVTAILVECIGSGAGGAGVAGGSNAALGGGGSGGGYARKWIPSPDSSYSYTVGAGGAGGAAGTNDGSNGNTTSFGNPSVCTAGGGTGGISMTAGTAVFVNASPNGGIGTVGDFLLRGTSGLYGLRLSGSAGTSGAGGAAARGGAGGSGRSSGGAGSAATSHGGGGAGGAVISGSASVAGGNGADGRIIIWEFGPA